MTTTGWDLLLRFAVMFFQIHLLGVLFLRLFRPEAVTREHLFAPAASPSADPSAGSLRSTGRFLLRLLRMVLWPLAGTVLAFFLPKPKDFVASPFLFAVWLLFMFAFLVVYLWKSFGAPPLRQALPVVVLSILLRGAAETAVQHSLTLPALAGPLVVRFLGLDFQRGSVTVVSSMGGFFQQASNVLLTAILILGATAPSLLRVYPKRLRGKARFLFVAFLAVLLAPIALYTELLRDISATRPYLPAELFGLLLVILLGLSYYFYSFETFRMLEKQRLALAEQEAEIAAQRFYNQQVGPIVDTLRSQRHGQENTLAVLAGLARARDYEGLERTLAQISTESAHLSPVDDKALHRIHSAALLGLLSAKAADARRSGVRFQLSVETDVDDLPVSVFTLCEILGVLLDNAIQAAAAGPQPQVRFEICTTSDGLAFRTTNDFDEAVTPDLDSLGEKGYTTKADGHGLGLHIVRMRLRSLPGVQLNPSLEGGWFTQELLLPVAGQKTADPDSLVERRWTHA